MGRKNIGVFGLINYRRHPDNPNYIVFGFNSEKEAALFEQELEKRKTRFEKDIEETKTGTVYLYAIAESSMDEANQANSAVTIAFKEPLLKNKLIRYSLLIFIAILLGIGIVGYVKNPTKVQKEAEQNQKDTTTLVE